MTGGPGSARKRGVRHGGSGNPSIGVQHIMVSRNPPVPNGYHSVTAYVRVRGADAAITFYKKAFGAREKFRLMMPGNRIGHAELDIGGSIVMLSEEFPEYDAIGPATIGGTSVALMIYVNNTDLVIARAVAAGARLRMPAQDMFYGDRSGQIEDPFGHVWMINEHKQTVSPKQMQRRLDRMVAESAPAPALPLPLPPPATVPAPVVRAPAPDAKAAAKPRRKRAARTNRGSREQGA